MNEDGHHILKRANFHVFLPSRQKRFRAVVDHDFVCVCLQHGHLKNDEW